MTITGHKIPTPISLTPHEEELLREITFDIRGCGHETARASCIVASQLAKSILAREAVPEIRLRFFTDAELKIGSKKSRKEVFESNGTIGDAILCHGHFLPYLKYFIFGPDLDDQVIAAFCRQAYATEYISGGDLPDLVTTAKNATRQRRRAPKESAQEFFKLALECGIDLNYARSIRDAVYKMRPS
ncbi:hypothetical protein SAMN05216299_10426 [Nitrosospira sp. Nsp14]|uniref:hypothetical protein n=1 Tax=Nitrosospira sp. Nsp14 TaxID=1855333 RepID=UPI0008E515AF|nr:hypothetical protein [Nitrosospira sp. Nsp14]SFH25421.1 hypothetical protein SAMN05216299_10426 [Nitrosospira sp. Nsp14]